MNLCCVVRRATVSDDGALGIIGPAVYAESYGHMWDDAAALASHLTSFGVPAVADFLARKDTSAWVVADRDRIVGFLTVILASPDPIEGGRAGAEIQRIYLLAPARGRGLAARMLESADVYARSEGMDHLWLDVMAEAVWARRSYAKLGFEEIGAVTFPGGMMERFKPMVVMRRCCV